MYSLESPQWGDSYEYTQHTISWYNKKFSLNICFLELAEGFRRDSKKKFFLVRISHGKRVLGVWAIEVRLYIVKAGHGWAPQDQGYELCSVISGCGLRKITHYWHQPISPSPLIFLSFRWFQDYLDEVEYKQLHLLTMALNLSPPFASMVPFRVICNSLTLWNIFKQHTHTKLDEKMCRGQEVQLLILKSSTLAKISWALATVWQSLIPAFV